MVSFFNPIVTLEMIGSLFNNFYYEQLCKSTETALCLNQRNNQAYDSSSILTYLRASSTLFHALLNMRDSLWGHPNFQYHCSGKA